MEPRAVTRRAVRPVDRTGKQSGTQPRVRAGVKQQVPDEQSQGRGESDIQKITRSQNQLQQPKERKPRQDKNHNQQAKHDTPLNRGSRYLWVPVDLATQRHCAARAGEAQHKSAGPRQKTVARAIEEESTGCSHQQWPQTPTGTQSWYWLSLVTVTYSL